MNIYILGNFGGLGMDIFNYFPQKIKEVILSNLKVEMYKFIEEIRLRNTKNIIIKLTNKDVVINYKVTSEDLIETISLISENSIYSYQSQMFSVQKVLMKAGRDFQKSHHQNEMSAYVLWKNQEYFQDTLNLKDLLFRSYSHSGHPII